MFYANIQKVGVRSRHICSILPERAVLTRHYEALMIETTTKNGIILYKMPEASGKAYKRSNKMFNEADIFKLEHIG